MQLLVPVSVKGKKRTHADFKRFYYTFILPQIFYYTYTTLLYLFFCIVSTFVKKYLNNFKQL